MKHLFFILTVVLLSSCTTTPDNIVHNEKTEPGSWTVNSVTGNVVQQHFTFYQIAPTWGQAFDYANKRADRPVKVFATIAFLLMFVVLFIGKAKEASWFPEILQNMILFNAVLFITLAAALGFYFSDPSGIKWNNDKWVSKEIYEKSIQETGSTKPIWDSLENNCLIVDGPYNCYKK